MNDLTAPVAAELSRAFERAVADAERSQTMGEIANVTRRLYRAWITAQPGALPAERFVEWQARHSVAEAAIVARRAMIRAAHPPALLDFAIDRMEPTLATFFSPPLRNQPATSDALVAAETRLGCRLPALLRALYATQDGGMTDFNLGTEIVDPKHVFPDDDFKAAYAIWKNVLPGLGLARLERLRALGEMSDETDFGGDPSWRDELPGVDRLVMISSHGWSRMACLDYRGSADPEVVLFDADHPSGPRLSHRQPDFPTFFRSLRRLDIQDDDGERRRGQRLLEEDET